MKILLVCAAGVTTSLMVKKMNEYLTEEDFVEARPVSEFEKIYKNYDVVLLGPQVRLKLKALQDLGKKENIPVDVIDMRAYGAFDGKKVVEQCKTMLKQ